MSGDGSVTHWFRLLQEGDHDAAQPLWERYCSRLEAVARTRLAGRRFAVADSEDVALSAFDSLCRGLKRGCFPSLNDRDNLWKILVVITARKVAHLVRDEQCQKRGGIGRPVPAGAEAEELEQIIGQEPTPAFAAQAAEEYQRLLASLGDKELEQVAVWKMEGYTNTEIATKLGRSLRSVNRKIRVIRRLWEREMEA
jgi:DNA-directed RNA polymerase specialized sigma24 family protein